MIKNPDKEETRTRAELAEHYEIEKKLADRLKNANKNERRTLYTSLYDELYKRVPHHGQLRRKASNDKQKLAVINQVKLLDRYLDDQKVFLEVGPGDCALSFHVAKKVKKVYAIDVSNMITEASSIPNNFSLMISDGSSIPVPNGSVDIVYSNQLMEHLHPEDSMEQLKNIYDSIVPGGIYLCITPNRLSGPHDISKYFDEIASGFHLREYTIFELSGMFKSVGFSKVFTYNKVLGKYVRTPTILPILLERFLLQMPVKLRRILSNINICKRIIKIRIVGVK